MTEPTEKPRHVWQCLLDCDPLPKMIFAATKAEAIERAKAQYPYAKSIDPSFYCEDERLRQKREQQKYEAVVKSMEESNAAMIEAGKRLIG